MEGGGAREKRESGMVWVPPPQVSLSPGGAKGQCAHRQTDNQGTTLIPLTSYEMPASVSPDT